MTCLYLLKLPLFIQADNSGIIPVVIAIKLSELAIFIFLFKRWKFINVKKLKRGGSYCRANILRPFIFYCRLTIHNFIFNLIFM